LRLAALAASSTTLARLPGGILLADTAPNSPIGKRLDAQGHAEQSDNSRASGESDASLKRRRLLLRRANIGVYSAHHHASAG
jgi:hypothetical protein